MSDQSGWRFVCASVAGTSHASTGIPCQDAFGAELHTDCAGEPVLVLVVSDGAGSAALAADGAALACATVLEEAARFFRNGTPLANLDADTASAWLDRLREVIATHAGQIEAPPRDLACTLAAAIVGESTLVCLQVGDGAIVFDAEAGYVPAFWPDSGEYANTTYFVTDDNATEHLRYLRIERRVEEVALFTDGLQTLALLFAERRAFAPFFDPLFRLLAIEPSGESDALAQELAAFLGSPRVNDRTDDDKTLVLATRRPEASDPSNTGIDHGRGDPDSTL